MAKIKIATVSKKFKTSLTKRKKRSTIKVSLPTKPSVPSSDMRRYSMLVHGEKKIGKTTLFAQEEGAMFLEFDPKQQALAIYQRHVPSWDHFLAYIDLFEKEAKKVKSRTKTIIVDGADIAYELCFVWCCNKLVIDHPHDEKDYGKSWRFIRTNFENAVLRLLTLKGIAARFICHSKWAEVDSRSGGKIEKLIPFLTTQAEEVLNGRIDIWAAYTYDGHDRILVVEGDERIGAGHRVERQFKTPDGDAIEEIYMGTSPQQAYRNLLKAFNNEQTYTIIEERRPKKKKKKIKVKVKK